MEPQHLHVLGSDVEHVLDNVDKVLLVAGNKLLGGDLGELDDDGILQDLVRHKLDVHLYTLEGNILSVRHGDVDAVLPDVKTLQGHQVTIAPVNLEEAVEVVHSGAAALTRQQLEPEEVVGVLVGGVDPADDGARELVEVGVDLDPQGGQHRRVLALLDNIHCH